MNYRPKALNVDLVEEYIKEMEGVRERRYAVDRARLEAYNEGYFSGILSCSNKPDKDKTPAPFVGRSAR